ncbi:hypothetical protein PRIPAC_71886 [Pristionchus pacificus]|uniref:Uncharacterized protein n=1 Tax=Pristionchus pacificus TaxID=54126 RepID=A0A2A6C5X7_PRIPA|nr:hypothetical protein PRIPAC_71886 [Pristionchus pacificus]|eukprot:PDM73421.1 hypothetical protein PRIPAC_40777 [Pristionchus pacificus]
MPPVSIIISLPRITIEETSTKCDEVLMDRCKTTGSRLIARGKPAGNNDKIAMEGARIAVPWFMVAKQQEDGNTKIPYYFCVYFGDASEGKSGGGGRKNGREKCNDDWRTSC